MSEKELTDEYKIKLITRLMQLWKERGVDDYDVPFFDDLERIIYPNFRLTDIKKLNCSYELEEVR